MIRSTCVSAGRIIGVMFVALISSVLSGKPQRRRVSGESTGVSQTSISFEPLCHRKRALIPPAAWISPGPFDRAWIAGNQSFGQGGDDFGSSIVVVIS